MGLRFPVCNMFMDQLKELTDSLKAAVPLIPPVPPLVPHP